MADENANGAESNTEDHAGGDENQNQDQIGPDETLDPDRAEDLAKIERMRKQMLITKLVTALNDNKTLGNDKKTINDDNQKLRGQISTLNAKLNQMSDQKSALLLELNKTTNLLEDAKSDNVDLLGQLETAMENMKSPKVMFIVDDMRTLISPVLKDGKYSWTICQDIAKVEDITRLTHDQSQLSRIQEHDIVVMLAGLANIKLGENGRQVATKLLETAERIVRHTGVEVVILALPPTKVVQAQVLLCNMRLSKSNQVPGIQYIPLEDLHEMERSKSLDGDTTLSSEGIDLLIKEMESKIIINPTRRPVIPLQPAIPVTPVIPVPPAGDSASATDSKPKSKSKAKKALPKSDTESDSTSDSEFEEILNIRRDQGGRLIGLGGERIKTLCAKHKAGIFVIDDIDDDDKSVVKIKGSEQNVRSALNHVKKILKIKNTRDPLSGVSPKPKKHKR